MKRMYVAFSTIAALSYGFAASADPARISTSEFAKDPAKVAALQKAVKTMRANNASASSNPAYYASWQYWANTHGYLGQGPNAAGTVATYVPAQIKARCDGDPVCISYYKHLTDSTLPQDDFTAQIWGTCQHGNLNFLPWHRLYLHFFERVLRKESGDVNFSLPYWDYFAERGKDGNSIALPTLVRGSSTGSLYDQFRTPGLNDYTNAIDAKTGSAAQAFKFSDFKNFSNQLQNQPHGAMHCGTGSGCTSPDMGLVPLAGLDPVFYMHHANIDRLWQCWLNREANGQTIDLAWAKAHLGMPDSWYDTKYQFVDENGKPVTVTIADVFIPGKIDTHYDKETDCTVSMPSSQPRLLATATVAPITQVPMANIGGVTLKGSTTTVSLQPSAMQKNLLAAMPAAGTKQGDEMLILENVDIQGDPGTTYNIYIGNKNNPKAQAYIATLNYFGVLEPMHAGHAHNGGGTAKIGTLTYDVQDELRQLGISSTIDVTVRFVPSNFVTESVKKRKINGGVTVGNIRLEKAGGQ